MPEDPTSKSVLLQSIGSALLASRKKLGLTQVQVARRMGVSAEFLARIERGHALPSVPKLAKLADVLGVSVDHLLGLERTRRVVSSSLIVGMQPALARLVKRVCRLDARKRRIVNLLIKESEDRFRGG